VLALHAPGFGKLDTCPSASIPGPLMQAAKKQNRAEQQQPGGQSEN
jgi:hypothetical protein